MLVAVSWKGESLRGWGPQSTLPAPLRSLTSSSSLCLISKITEMYLAVCNLPPGLLRQRFLGDCLIWVLHSILHNGPLTMMPPSLYAQVQLLMLAEKMDTIHGTDKHIYEFQNIQGQGWYNSAVLLSESESMTIMKTTTNNPQQ